MELYNSNDIGQADDLYTLLDTFTGSGIPFKYELTAGELEWWVTIYGRYFIGDYIAARLDGNILTLTDPQNLTQALENDGMHPKAVMLSDDSALHRLFFWLG